MRTISERGGNGKAEEEFEALLERLVSEEVEALEPAPEPPIEALLDQLAARLRLHPDRGALLDRLRALVLDDAAPGPAPPAEPPPTDQG